MVSVVSQAVPFAERGRVWSRCNNQVVAEERNYRPLLLGNKMLTSAKHVDQTLPLSAKDVACETRVSEHRKISVHGDASRSAFYVPVLLRELEAVGASYSVRG